MTNYEKIIDPNNMDNIQIINSKGICFELEQIALIPLHNVGYAILKPLNPSLLDLGNDDPLIFKLNDEEETLELCTDINVITKIIDLYNKNY